MSPCNCAQASTFEIFTGNAKTMTMKAVYAENGDPLDLTSCSAISVALPNADGSFTALLLGAAVTIISPATIGKIGVAISSLVSGALNIGELQDVDVTYTISGKAQTVRYKGALSVFKS